MESFEIANIEGGYDVSRVGDHIIVTGRCLWIFSLQGELLTHRKDLSNIRKIIDINSEQVLLDCGPQKAYILLSVTSGREIWRVSHPKMDFTSARFAASADKQFVYDYCVHKDGYLFVKINVPLGEVEVYPLETGLRAVLDILCDQDGTPCLLQCQNISVSGVEQYINGVRYVCQDALWQGSDYFWKSIWQSDSLRHAKLFWGDTETILTNDLYIFKPGSNRFYPLLEDRGKLPCFKYGPISCSISTSNNYIAIQYDVANIIIDGNTRKVSACYASETGKGCIVNNTYWYCTKTALMYKPFPYMETVIPQKTKFWSFPNK